MNFLAVHKNKLIKGSVLLFLIAMLSFPSASFQGASTGLLLWFHNVLPNLLPFIIISNLMVRLDITKQISKVFYPFLGRLFRVSSEGCYPIAIGFLSGIPMGAKSTADLVSEHKIHKKEGQFLLNMCNNASPMFILGYIAISQLKLPHIKYALFVIIYASAILSALIFRYFNRFVSSNSSDETKFNKLEKSQKAKQSTFSFEILDSSIMNGFEIVTKIGGYIILFSILAQIINEVGPDISFYKAFLMGMFEITTGINQICKLGININTKIVLVAVLTSFGGFSGMAQTKSVLGDSRLSMKSYFIVKLLNAILSLLFAFLYISLYGIK
ncbi:MAG: putative rane protein [Herbinix sp.]|jgi:sporulation integral membrane protein YlbJ|nr:putative rane protein [Herbinix sp.]